MFNFCIFIAYRLRLNLQYIAFFYDHFYAKPFCKYCDVVQVIFLNKSLLLATNHLL